MAKLPSLAALLALLPVTSAVADDWVADNARPPPVDMPVAGVDTHARTAFHLITRFSPATSAHVWQFDPSFGYQLAPGLGLTFAWPMAFLSPQNSTRPDRFAEGNLRIGVVGGIGVGLVRATDEADALNVRLGGAIDLYAPTSPLPDDDRLTPIAAQGFNLLDPSAWAIRSTGFRARIAVGVETSWWGVSADLSVAPSFTVDQPEVQATLWIIPAIRTRVVLFEVIEPFLELGGSIAAIESTTDVGDGLLARTPSGFQMIPGVRFHAGIFDPAVMVYIQPNHAGSAFSVAVDLAGAIRRRVRAKDENGLDRF